MFVANALEQNKRDSNSHKNGNVNKQLGGFSVQHTKSEQG